MWSKVTKFMVLVTVTSLFVIPFEIEARGGRGGGGRGGGGRAAGSARAGHSMNRTPSMSRVASRPSNNRPSANRSNISRPSDRALASQGRGQAAQRMQQRPSSRNTSELKGQVSRYAQSRPAQNIDRGLSQRAQDFSRNRGSQIAQDRQLSNNVSQRLRSSRHDYDNWFNQGFFDRHGLDVGYARYNGNLWRPAAWATLATWGAWNWATPYYYDEGYAYPVTYEETASYATAPASPTTYSQPIQTQTEPQADASGDWLPLGVFAVANSASAAAQTNRFIQLAVNRSGEIAGVFYNAGTDQAQDVTGTVDANSQKAYWSLSDKADSPIASTGLYNLTQDKTTVDVHFPSGADQTWTLVRLNQ